MNHVTTLFNSNEFGELRTIIIENEVYFVAKSVATALGYKDTADAIRKHIDEEDKLRWQIADTGQKRETYLINESGLYSLILKSKMPSAKKFKRWVTSEVLPQIRKTGSYDLHIPKTLPEALRLYADEVEAHAQSKAIIEQQKQQIAEYEPKVDYVDKILSSTNAMTVTQIAADYGLSAKALNKILHDAHIQRSVNGQWILYSDLKRIYEKDHIEFDCKSIQDTPMVGEVYYSVDKYQWRCKAINQQDTQQHDAVLDFDLAFVLNNGKVKVIGNRLEGYEHE